MAKIPSHAKRRKINYDGVIGKKFFRLTILEIIRGTPVGVQAKAKCECGKTIVCRARAILTDRSKSCGCLHREVTSATFFKHGHSGHRMYRIWRGIKCRCLNPKDYQFKNYGGRGITICKRWINSFENFWEDMIIGYRDDLEVDRKNINGNYTPENCRWATRKQQTNNSRQNHLLTFNGKTQPLTAWSEELGIPIGALRSRVRDQWPIEIALTAPINHRHYAYGCRPH